MKIFVCGGGTGGHFFSGIAVAEKFLDLHPEARVVLIGTRYGIEARTSLKDSRMSVRFVAARGVKGRGLFSKIQALSMMVVGFFQSIFLLLTERPRIVIGVGGYASVPTVLAALGLRIFFSWRVMILEQNSHAGLANRVFRLLGARALAAFPCAGFELVTLPLRKYYEERARELRSANWPPKTLLLLGGSQGAKGLNEKWTKMLVELKQARPDIEILHQTGPRDLESMQNVYRDLKMRAEVFSFSDDMPRYFERADLIVSRSGAMTVFETILFKRPAVFVPFPAATDDHQRKNALAVQESQWIIDERDFDWANFSRLLKAEAPLVPAPRNTGQVEWAELLG